MQYNLYLTPNRNLRRRTVVESKARFDNAEVWLRLTCLLIAVLFLFGCGGPANSSLSAGNNSGTAPSGSSTSSTAAPATTPVELRVGSDAEANQIFALPMNLIYVKAKNSQSGAEADLLPAPRTVELAHLAATSDPVSSVAVNQDTYDQVEVSMTGVAISYIDPNSGNLVHQDLSSFTFSETITLSAPIVVADAASIVELDFDVLSTINLNPSSNPPARRGFGLRPIRRTAGTANGATVNTPVIHVSQNAIENPGQQQHQEGGLLNNVIGEVTQVGVSSFNVQVGGQNDELVFNIDQNTVFENVSWATLNGMTVEVNGYTLLDGSFLADEVEGLDTQTGTEIEGLLAGTTSSGALFLVAQGGFGGSMTSALVGQNISIDQSGAAYAVNSGDFDISGLLFDASHIRAGQQVEVESSGALSSDPDGNAGLMTPYMVELESQTISGSVVNYDAGSGAFDLVLAANDPLNVQPTNSVHVIQQSATYLYKLTQIQNGQNLQVRGLLFSSLVTPDTPVSWTMVAARITD
jgi:uncharacterized protein DUF5666